MWFTWIFFINPCKPHNFCSKSFLMMVVYNICYFPVLITPELLSLLFTFLCIPLNLRPKEKL